MIRILDLFAGAGGLSLGFEETKQFEVVGIVENNKNAAKTYIKNHPDLTNYEDILTVDFKEIKKECGPIDIIIGGPPCQGFSNANRQRRQLINGSNELVKKYVEAISVLQPKAFVMENVKTIASDKHSFCVTYNDENHIVNELGLQIHNKDVVLYEGDLANDILALAKDFRGNSRMLLLLNEEEIYFLYNLVKKRNKINHLLNNSQNIKVLSGISNKLIQMDEMPRWFNSLTHNARESICHLLDAVDIQDTSWVENIMKFWSVHRFFLGLEELERKNAIFSYSLVNHSIQIHMKTYIVIDYIRASFSFLHYRFNGDVLNAAQFGVPQTRERFVLIGVKDKFYKGDIELPKPIIEDPNNYVTVDDALRDLYEIIPTTESMDETQKRSKSPVVDTYYRNLVMVPNYKLVHNHVCTATTKKALERFALIEQGGNFHSLPAKYKSAYENPNRTQNTVYKKLKSDLPSDTVVNVRKSMWIHPEFIRAISAREAARLQSFPDDYIFYGTKDSVYQQIGNAVPPVLGRAVAEVILKIFGVSEKDYTSLKELYQKYNGNEDHE